MNKLTEMKLFRTFLIFTDIRYFMIKIKFNRYKNLKSIHSETVPLLWMLYASDCTFIHQTYTFISPFDNENKLNLILACNIMAKDKVVICCHIMTGNNGWQMDSPYTGPVIKRFNGMTFSWPQHNFTVRHDIHIPRILTFPLQRSLIPKKLSQYRVCWSPSFCLRQTIINHDIDSRGHVLVLHQS